MVLHRGSIYGTIHDKRDCVVTQFECLHAFTLPEMETADVEVVDLLADGISHVPSRGRLDVMGHPVINEAQPLWSTKT